MWFLDFFALIKVVPGVRNPAKIIALLHCAEPLFSKYLIDFKFDDPLIVKGKFLPLFF